MSLKNVEFCLADAGFTANDIPANAESMKALPAECRGDTAAAGSPFTPAVTNAP